VALLILNVCLGSAGDENCVDIIVAMKVGVILAYQCMKRHLQQIQCHIGRNDSYHPNLEYSMLYHDTFGYLDYRELEKSIVFYCFNWICQMLQKSSQQLLLTIRQWHY